MSNHNPNIEEIIRRFNLKPLPEEGGYFCEMYRSEEELAPSALPQRYTTAHRMYTSIYYLITDQRNGFSALHQLKTDEIYHFYLGDPVRMALIDHDGTVKFQILGTDFIRGQSPQFLVPQGVWQGAKLCSGGKYALLGTTMAPGYTQEDFTLGKRETLIRLFPHAISVIEEYTHPLE